MKNIINSVENAMTDDNLIDYELHLTGGLVESKSTIDQYLKSKWLDAKTRCLHVLFQMYIPDTDMVTVVEIHMTTDSGILYKISTDVSRYNLYINH